MYGRCCINPSFILKHWGKELFFVVLGQALAAVGALVGVRLLTEVLAPTLYGQLALAMTLFTLIQQLLVGPFAGAFTRFYTVAFENNEVPSYLQSIFWLMGRFGLLVLILGAAAVIFMEVSGQGDLVLLTVTTILFTLIAGTNIFLDGIQTAARHRIVVAWHQSISIWLRFLGAVLLISLLSASSQVAMAGYAISALFVLASQAYFFKFSISKDINYQTLAMRPVRGIWVDKINIYASPSIIWGIFTWAQMTSDRWALQAFTSTQVVGYYSALYQIGYYPIILLSTVLSQFISPILFHQVGEATDLVRWEKAKRLVGWLVLASSAGTMSIFGITLLLHKPIFGLLVGDEYRIVSSYLPWLTLSAGLFTIGQMKSLLIMTTLNPKQLLLPKILTAVAGVLLNFLGAMWFGLPGIVFASIIFSASYLAWVSILTTHHFQHKFIL